MKFNLGDLGLGDFSLGDLGLGDFNLGDLNLGDFDLIPPLWEHSPLDRVARTGQKSKFKKFIKSVRALSLLKPLLLCCF